MLAYCSVHDKTEQLFQFYDLKGKGYIDEASLLQMIFSFPKAQIKSLVNDDVFREFVKQEESRKKKREQELEDSQQQEQELVSKSLNQARIPQRKMSICSDKDMVNVD